MVNMVKEQPRQAAPSTIPSRDGDAHTWTPLGASADGMVYRREVITLNRVNSPRGITRPLVSVPWCIRGIPTVVTVPWE